MGKLFRLYIDESGDHHYHDYSDSKYDEPSLRYLGLMGVVIEKEIYQKAHGNLEALKQKHFVYDPDAPIIFHRTDIIHKKGPFFVLKNPQKEIEFNNDLLNFLKALDLTLIVVVIDKKAYIERYKKSAFHPYHHALTAMLERYCGYLNFWNSRGDTLVEHRGKKEDGNLEKAYSYVFNNGTYYHPPSFFQRALTSKEVKVKDKNANISGLQIADLLAHPCKQNLLFEEGRIEPLELEDVFGRIICNAIKDKYNVQIYSQRVKGYGKVFLG
jgi:hypothetical protein